MQVHSTVKWALECAHNSTHVILAAADGDSRKRSPPSALTAAAAVSQEVTHVVLVPAFHPAAPNGTRQAATKEADAEVDAAASSSAESDSYSSSGGEEGSFDPGDVRTHFRCRTFSSEDVLDTLYRYKAAQRLLGDFLTMVQKDQIHPFMRADLLGWLFSLNRHFGFPDEVFAVTAQLVDRFLGMWSAPLPSCACVLCEGQHNISPTTVVSCLWLSPSRLA